MRYRRTSTCKDILYGRDWNPKTLTRWVDDGDYHRARMESELLFFFLMYFMFQSIIQYFELRFFMYQKCNINKVCLIDWSIHTGIQTQRVGKWTQVADQEELRVPRRSKQWECNTQLGNSVAVQWHTQKIIKKDMHDIQISKNNFTSKSRVIITNPTIHFEKLSICSKPNLSGGVKMAARLRNKLHQKGATLSLCLCLHIWATRGMNGWQKKEEDAKLSFCGESDSKSIPGKFGQQEAHFPAFSPHVQVPSSLPSPLPVPLFLLPVSQPIEWQNVEATASRQAKTKTRTYCSENSEREKQYKQIH